jgi:biopolymer transport protein ExbB
LLCLIIGLAVAIERILYLSFSKINTKKFIAQFEEALNNGGIEAAKEVARNTKGPLPASTIRGHCATTRVWTLLRKPLHRTVRYRMV